MTPAQRALAAVLALGLAAYVSAAYAEPRAAAPRHVAPDVAQDQIDEALALFDARRVLRLRDGRFDQPAGVSDQDKRRARHLLLAAAASGSPQARDYAARLIQAGLGGPANASQARKLYEESATRSARWRLAGMLERGEGGPRDLVSARALYKLASDQGQLDARYDYARMARRGEGGPVDLAAAVTALSAMGEACHGDAADELAAMLEHGEGLRADARRAAEFHLQALACASRFYAPPQIVARWSSIERSTRVEIGKLLRARGVGDAPTDGSSPPPGWAERYLAARKG